MIASQIDAQALALGLFCAIGLVFGIIFFSLFLWQRLWKTSFIANTLNEIVLSISFGLVLFLIEFFIFDYDIHFYHFSCMLFSFCTIYVLLRKLTKNHFEKMQNSVQKFKIQVKKNKFVSRIFK